MSACLQAKHPGGSDQLSDQRQQQNRRTWHHCALWWGGAPPTGSSVSLQPQPQHHNGCSFQKLSQVVISLNREIIRDSNISNISNLLYN